MLNYCFEMNNIEESDQFTQILGIQVKDDFIFED